MHQTVALTHGNLRLESAAFVAKSGELRLGGFELSFRSSEEPLVLQYGQLTKRSSTQQYRSWPPEVSSPSGAFSVAQLRQMEPHCIDVWMLSALLKELWTPSTLPQELQSSLQVRTNPADRPSLSKIINSTILHNLSTSFHCRAAGMVDRLAAVSAEERIRIIGELRKLSHSRHLSNSFLSFKILPSLPNFLETNVSPEAVALFLEAAASLEKSDSPIELPWRNIFIRLISLLFARPDRAVRLALLDGLCALPNLASRIDEATVQETIYPQLVAGFVDALPQLRESTLKASSLFASKYSSRQLNSELLRFYARLQTDAEPSIRVNTTICLQIIAPLLDAKTRERILVMALIRSLKDTFPPARKAAIDAISGASQWMTEQELATQVLPALIPIILDPNGDIRQQCIVTCEVLFARIKSYSLNSASNSTPVKTEENSTNVSSPIAMKENQDLNDGWSFEESPQEAPPAVSAWSDDENPWGNEESSNATTPLTVETKKGSNPMKLGRRS